MAEEGTLERVCGNCAAFTQVHVHPTLGTVGRCAIEVFPPPLRPVSSCPRFRAKGTRGPIVPEKRARNASSSRTTSPSEFSLPEEIDLDMDIDTFRNVLSEVLRQELGISKPDMVPRWQGGDLILKPGKEGTQEKRIPIETFFSKIVMVRDRLRLLEAKVNAHTGLSSEDKVLLQSYISGCYGSLTTFNVLFSEKDDQFSGQKEG